MRKMNFYFALLGMMCVSLLSAQDNDNQMFWVHEDRVMPSMTMEYEETAKALVENCQKHNIQDMSWIAASTTDFRYLFITPIKSMSDINYDGFGTLQEGMGEEAFTKLFADMNKCYTSHGDYILTLDTKLSYMPDGITQTPDGQDYRKFYYVKTTPGMAPKLQEKFQAIKDFYAQKGAKVHYRVYRSGFGTQEDYYLVAIAAKDAVSFETIGDENDAILGDDRHALFQDMMKYVTSIDEVAGMMRPDLAYNPKQ